MTARAPSPPTGPWIWADDLVAWIAAQTLGMALAAARDELNAAWRGGRIEAFHGRSDRKEPKPVPPEASAHPTAAIRPGNRIVGASAMVPVRRAGELIQQVLLAEVSFAGVRFSRIEALALWPEAEEAAERTKQEVEAQAVSEAIEHTLEAAEQAERDRVTAIAKAAADAKEAAEKAERNRIAAEKTAALAGNGNEGKQPARAKPRGISFAALDRPLIEDMHRMLTATPPEAANPWQAALVVSQRATGHGGPISKSKRLLSRYSAAFRTEHD